uniref:Uncharacterized protein n=1 Tax=Wuchereria bancrofti TaxID=6293 RepID=A0AAF5RV48_WUCBA
MILSNNQLHYFSLLFDYQNILPLFSNI